MNQIFPDTCFFCRKLEDHKYFHIQVKKVYMKWVRFLSKTPKNSIWGHFLDILGPPKPTGLCFKNQTPLLLLLYYYLTSGNKIRKN